VIESIGRVGHGGRTVVELRKRRQRTAKQGTVVVLSVARVFFRREAQWHSHLSTNSEVTGHKNVETKILR